MMNKLFSFSGTQATLSKTGFHINYLIRIATGIKENSIFKNYWHQADHIIKINLILIQIGPI